MEKEVIFHSDNNDNWNMPNSKIREFKVNKHILLRLERKNTILYINGKRFIYCKRLVIIIPETDIERYDGIESIDEVSDLYDHYLIDNEMYKKKNGELHLSPHSYDILPETEFWGHCSNIQAWVELNYDTRILHSNLAFPLLKELTKAGDPVAQRVFKEEIAKRISSGYFPTIKYLISEGYLFFLTDEELLCALDICKEKLEYPHYIKVIYEVMKKWDDYTFSLEDINKRIIKLEEITNFFSGLITDTKIRKYLGYYINEFYDRLNKDLINILHNYCSAYRRLCWDYFEAGMYDKLLEHCTFILSQDSKSSYPWEYLGVAYRKKGLISYAKEAEDIYKMKERLKRKRIKKVHRKFKRKHLLWRYFFRYFSHGYLRLRKCYHKRGKRKVQC
ncbi:MAG: hypothetical protein ACFFG0_34885 [Candidatus Thorarchaeota archaeon]